MSAEELVGFLLSMTSVLDGVYLPLSAGRLALVVVSGLLLAYIAYYFGWVAGRPQVVGAGVLKETLIKKCPILSECYWPTFWAYQCHLSTIMRFLLQKNPSITYRRCTPWHDSLIVQYSSVCLCVAQGDLGIG